MLFQTPCLWILTVDLHDAPSKLCKVISNSDIKSPAHQFQHVSLYHYHHRTATHCRRRAPWSTPICGPSQGKLVELNNPMHHPTTTSLQQHPCAPATTSTRTTNWRVEGVWGEWVEGENKARRMMMMRCAAHTPRCLVLFPPFIWRRGVQPTRRVVYFFSSPFPILSDDTVWNPHAMSSISFPPHIIWRRGVKPTCRVVYLFSSPYYLTMRCETHMLRRLVLFLPILSDDAVWNPHAALSISFPPILFDDAACNPHAVSSISFPPHIIWRRGVQPTRHVVYSLVLFPPYYLTMWCETHTPRRLFLFPPYYLMMWHETHTPHHLFLFPSILSDNMAIYIPLEFIRSVLCYNL